MRVLQVASSLHDWGGIERYVLYLIEGLRGRGHNVDITCPAGSPLWEKASGPNTPLSVQRKHSPRALSAYVRLLRRTRYDIVHIHFNPDFLVAGVAARLTKQPRVILTRHVALPWSKSKVKMYLPLFDHIIPVSDAVRRKLSDSGIPEERMTVAKAGCPALTPTPTAPKLPGFNVGVFGRLVPEKGLDVVLDGAVALPDISFHIFGSGPLEDSLRRSPSPNVTLHGFTDKVADWMSAMDAIAIPSRWEEAFPYSALEAMSLGKPVIVSKIGGLPEVVQDGVTGVLFEAGSARAFAQAVDNLMKMNLERMADDARRLHRSEYTVEKMAERIESVYEG